MARLLLVHGGLHGAWCWEPLVPKLSARGIETHLVELPGHGKRQHETATLDTYTKTVADEFVPGDVLVGHSLGGAVITLAADVLGDAVGGLIYIAGYPVQEGRTIAESATYSGTDLVSYLDKFDVRYSENKTSWWLGTFEGARRFFYHDCDELIARWAYDRLTPQQVAPSLEAVTLAQFDSLDLPITFIQCEEDRALAPEVAAEFAHRLGVEPVVLPGAHSPFLSQPGVLAEVIQEALRP
jgi:pimeloyl-ACP methyl ester carboxylesterase